MTWEDTHTHKHACTHAHIVINSGFAPPCHAIQNTVHIGFWAFDNVVSFIYFIYICVPSMIYKERTYILISSVFICIHIHINSYYNILMQTSVGEPLSILAVPPGQAAPLSRGAGREGVTDRGSPHTSWYDSCPRPQTKPTSDCRTTGIKLHCCHGLSWLRWTSPPPPPTPPATSKLPCFVFLICQLRGTYLI